MPNLTLAAAATCYVCGVISIALAVVRLLDVLGVIHLGRVWRRVIVGVVLFLFIIALLVWADGGQTIAFNIVNLLSGTLSDSIPIMLGALTGVICSSSGVINIAIEGQLLLGAFCAAIATSVTGSLWLGLVCGALAGSLVGILLALFAIAYRVDQVVLGVVLNTLVLGLTGYLYNALLTGHVQQHAEQPEHLQPAEDPAAGRHPDHRPGPVRRHRLPLHHLHRARRRADRAHPDPLGPAHPGGRRAPGGGRHRRHPGAGATGTGT